MRHAPSSEDGDDRLNWFLLKWEDRWGRPPPIVLIGLWLINGPIALLLFGMSIGAFAFAPEAGKEGPLVGLMALMIGAALAAAGYYLFLRPLWRAQSYYSSFSRDPHTARGESEPPPTPDGGLSLLEDVQPHSVQCDRQIAACHETLARHYSLRQVSDKELPRHEKFLRNVVNPSMEGQIKLLDACEIGRPPQRLIFAVVSYRHEYSSGRSRIVEERVGQLVMVGLGRDIGRLWIRPEGTSDKLAQWWSDDDLDFAAHPQFSHRYHCQSDNPTLALLRIPDPVWQAIGQRTAIIVRVQGSIAVVGKEGPLDSEHASEIVALGFDLMEAFAADATD